MEGARRSKTETVSGSRVRVTSAYDHRRFVQQGLSWSEIGDAMNRPSPDCRYRFEVYLHVADRQRQGMYQCLCSATNYISFYRPMDVGRGCSAQSDHAGYGRARADRRQEQILG